MKPIGNGSNDFPGLPQSLVFASTPWLASNADVAKKFGEALAKGLDYANAHPDAVRAVDAKCTKMSAEDSRPWSRITPVPGNAFRLGA